MVRAWRGARCRGLIHGAPSDRDEDRASATRSACTGWLGAAAVLGMIGSGCDDGDSAPGSISHLLPPESSGMSSDAPPPLPSDNPWSLVFSDEFDSTAEPSTIDASKWSYEVNCWGGGNNERQCYTRRPENSFLQGGQLHIVAREESFSGPAINDDDPSYDPTDVSATLPFTSARLRTKGKFDFAYGRVEMRAQLAGGPGMWPAFWMLPTEGVYGTWPSSGEIDVLEAVNLGVPGAPNVVYGTLHYGLPWPQWSPHGASHELTADLTQSFHLYAVEWEADEIRWYVDGVHYQTQRSEGWYNYIWQGQSEGFQVAGPRAPYDQAFHLLLNLAVGGDFPGPPDSGWGADRSLSVDSVRVYQCASGNDDGTGCAGAADPIDPAVTVNEDAGRPRTQIYSLLDEGPRVLPGEGDGASLTVTPGFYAATEGNVTAAFADAGAERGQVWDVTFTGPGNVYLTATALDGDPPPGMAAPITSVSLEGGAGWANVGELSFNLLIESRSDDTQFLVKIDSGYPNLGQVAIEAPPVGQWTRVAVRLSDLLTRPEPSGSGLNIGNVLNAFVLEPTGSAQAHVMIDDVELRCSVNERPLSWQTNTTCGVGVRSLSPIAPTDIAP
jgi:beta-glucanase (GH16 family)